MTLCACSLPDFIWVCLHQNLIDTDAVLVSMLKVMDHTYTSGMTCAHRIALMQITSNTSGVCRPLVLVDE